MFKDNENIKFYLRDVRQAYVQSTFNLKGGFYIRLPPELISLLNAPLNCIVKVMILLYSVLEVGNHWLAIYCIYYKKKLEMRESIYDPCFLYNSSPFGIMRI